MARRRSGGGGSRFAVGLVAGVLVVAGIVLVTALRSPSRRPAPGPESSKPPATVTAPAPAPAARRTVEEPAPAKIEPPLEASKSTTRPEPASVPATKIARTTPAAQPKPHAVASPPSTTPVEASLPRVAIVIDDCGQRLDLMERAVRSGIPLTFAVIPHLPQSRPSAEAAHAAGHEVIVHQPMAPESGDEDPGEAAIAPGMRADRIARILRASFDDVPHADGLNNHMGSRATSDAVLMEATFDALSKVRPDALFLDSRTSAQTVALGTARRRGIRSTERNVFLDNDLDPVAIRAELDRLVALASQQGQAVAIGHLKPETLSVLEAALPGMAGKSCRFVFLSDLVR